MMRTRGREDTRSAAEYIGRELQSEWHLAREYVRRELRKLYPPAGTPPGLHALFREERRRNLFRGERRRNVEALRFLLRRR
jgi:hypothetical protein